MRYEVHCATCDKEVDQVVIERDVYRRADIVVAWCHGKYAEVHASDTDMASAMDPHKTYKMIVFTKPVRIIVDRDLGDEDSDQPWQGETCQM